MDKLMFLNVGWMSKYSGPGQIIGGGKYVTIQGYGHEMLNFKPFAGKMYGTAVISGGYGNPKLEKLGAMIGISGFLAHESASKQWAGMSGMPRVHRIVHSEPKSLSMWQRVGTFQFLGTANGQEILVAPRISRIRRRKRKLRVRLLILPRDTSSPSVTWLKMWRPTILGGT